MKRKYAWLAAIGLIGVIAVVLALPTIREWRETSARSENKADLKQLMLALHNYHNEYNSFPPTFVVGPDGKRWHSWRALILKDVDPVLAAEYRWDEPWDGPNNSKLHGRCPDVFQRAQATDSPSAAGYFAIVGKRTIWPADQAMRIRDICDGTSNTLALVEDDRTDTVWLQPQDLLTGELYRDFYKGSGLYSDPGRLFAVADGSVRFLPQSTSPSSFTSGLFASSGGDTYRGTQWPPDLVDEPTAQTLRSPRSADELTGTEVVPISSELIQPGINQLWCVSFQLSWNQLKQRVGGDVVFPGGNRIADALNQYPVPADLLSSESVFVAQTDGTADSDREMLANLHQKFPSVNLSLSEFPDGNFPKIRLFSVVRKTMPFDSEFNRFDAALQFRCDKTEVPVNSFGQQPRDTLGTGDVFISQLKILDDRGDHDFILQLNTDGPQADQIILAHVEARESLQATWDSVRVRIKSPNPEHIRPRLQENETLQIPILDLSLTQHFSELEGLVEGFGPGGSIVFAVMQIRLRLDETGADFLSAADMGVVGSYGDPSEEVYEPLRVRKFIFDKPFFIALKEPQAEAPYFMAWIANGELMESYSEEPAN